jgi:hypothetical protein
VRRARIVLPSVNSASKLAQLRPHRLRNTRVDDRLLALAVNTRRVDRVVGSHAEVQGMHHRVEDAGGDAVPAGAARPNTAWPSFAAAMVGTAKMGILPGVMQLARSGRGSKFCIESFRNTPVPGTSTSEPNELVRLVQSVALFPAWSAAAIWLVPATPPADDPAGSISGAMPAASYGQGSTAAMGRGAVEPDACGIEVR